MNHVHDSLIVRPRWGRKAMLPWAAALLLTSCVDGVVGDRFVGLELSPAKPKPSFTLTSTSGQTYDFRRETDGQLTLLFFGYTSCPDICPVHLANIGATLDRLSPEDRARVRVVFVTTDPARDSLPRIRAWLDNFDSTFVGLRGERDEVTEIESSLGIAPSVVPEGGAKGYDVGHAAQVIAFTPDDSMRVLYPFGTRQQDWAHDLPRLLAVGKRR